MLLVNGTPQPDPLVLQTGTRYRLRIGKYGGVLAAKRHWRHVPGRASAMSKYGPKPEFLTSPQNRTFSRIQQDLVSVPPSVENIAPIALQSVGITEKFAGFGLAEDAFTHQGVDEADGIELFHVIGSGALD